MMDFQLRLNVGVRENVKAIKTIHKKAFEKWKKHF